MAAAWAFVRRNWWKLLLAPVALAILLYLWSRWRATLDSENRWRKAVLEAHDIESRATDARDKARAQGALAVERVEEQYAHAIQLAHEREAELGMLADTDRQAYQEAVNAAWGNWRAQ